MTVRRPVVEAIMRAFLADDPTAYPVDATAAERVAAEDLIRTTLRVDGADRDPRQQVRRMLYRRYQSGDDWDELFGRLSPAEIARLHELFPHMPPRAARHFAERFIIPRSTA